MAQPSEKPAMAARVEPTASITARTSSIRSSSEGAPVMRSDRPWPRLSKAMTWAKAGEAPQEGGVARQLVLELEMRDHARDHDDVDRPVTHHLVGDVHVAALNA